ncbi:MAG: hypothetical protein WCW87_03740 [Candidatus Paceibacterota bacterium]
MDSEISKIIDEGVDFLGKEQQIDGSFLSLSSSDQNDFKNAKIYHSIFSSALILSCLCGLNESKKSKKIKDKIAKFLISQKSSHWSFNYWVRNSNESKKLPYPDDLDDTFCSLSALYLHNPDLINGEVLAKVVMLLTSVEEKEGGPYKTWLTHDKSGKAWTDVDLVVNSNIDYFLSLQDTDLNSIAVMTEKAIKEHKYYSQYYPSFYPVIYFISRSYKGSKKNDIIDFILSKQKNDGSWSNVLNTALSISALLNLGFSNTKLKNSISYLIKCNEKDLLKNPYAFCIDPAIDKKTYFSGSPALTVVFCLEALSKYKNFSNNLKLLSNTEEKDRDKIYSSIVKKAKVRFSELDCDLKKYSLECLDKILKVNKSNHIVLLPYFFNQALKRSDEIDKKLIIELGLADLYGWIAYTIYDDFLDNEGDPKLLSVANVCLREVTSIFYVLFKKDEKFLGLFNEIMDKIDAANAWEVTNCRMKVDNSIAIQPKFLPDYENYERLADRSLGYILGPLAIIVSLGYGVDSCEVKNTLNFFKHYIIARQLNDDSHDLKEDLGKGILSSVVTLVLKKNKIKKEIDVINNIDYFQNIFWNDVVGKVCDDILSHVNESEKIITRIDLFKKSVFLKELLEPIRDSAKNTLKEQKKTLQFLEAYKN